MTDDSCNNVWVFAANIACSHNRDGDGAEGHRSGVSKKHGNSCFERLHAEGKNHGRGNCHGSTEPCEGFKQTTEAEGNQNRLDAQIAAAQTVEGAAQVFKASGKHGDLVEPDSAEDHPADHQTVDSAAHRAEPCQVEGHRKAEACHQDRCGKCHQRRPVCACLDDE